MNKLFTIAAVLLFSVVVTACSQKQNLADLLMQAEATHQSIPVLSVQYPAMDIPLAYRVQKTYVEKKLTTEKIAGFKAGLTSRRGQKRFGVSAPIAGVLFESGKLTGKVTVDKEAFRHLMLETEIGFVIGSPMTQPVDDVAALRKSIKAVMPIIELPDVGFADMKRLTGVDIIAANVSAKQFIAGQPQLVDGVDLNTLTVTLSLDGQEMSQGIGAEASGDQWQAALWLVNTMIEQGWTIEPGNILLTGALGKMLPGNPGEYVADYGSFGTIIFEVK
jgi:2-keto-4-pentenoate hydratase